MQPSMTACRGSADDVARASIRVTMSRRSPGKAMFVGQTLPGCQASRGVALTSDGGLRSPARRHGRSREADIAKARPKE